MTISGNDGVLNLMDLPTEVIELGLFPYLKQVELKRMKLNRRLTDIANSVIEKRDRKCKYKLQSLVVYKCSQIIFIIIINFHIFHQIMYNYITGSYQHQIIDIKEPLRNLKNKLEAKLTIDLTDYDFYLQGT